MKKTIKYKDIDLHYQDLGSGPAILLLHGYLERGDIYASFASRLQKDLRLLIPDLPGHGRSGTWGPVHPMEDLAEAMKAILDREGLESVTVIGHSMGGYVLMAFAEHYPDRLHSGVLLHSTCYADTDKKRLDRDREIALVRKGRLGHIARVNIPRAFSDTRPESMAAEVEMAVQIAEQSPVEGVEALLNGMKRRPDRSMVLKRMQDRFLLVAGMKDNYISSEVYEGLAVLAPGMQVCWLEESGHMGFVEQPDKLITALMDFLSQVK